MGWYNSGNWTGLDGTEIPHVYADLCNALNERREALGLSRISWTVISGTKSTNLSASDFVGMDMNKTNPLETVRTNMLTLLEPSGGYNTTSRHSGWAKTSTNSGLAANSDLWTNVSASADAGISDGTSDGVFEVNKALYLKAIFDRMLYPVVYPALKTRGSLDGVYSGQVGTPDPYDPIDVWDNMLGPGAGFAPGLTTGDIGAYMKGIEADVGSPGSPSYVPYYTSGIWKTRTITFYNFVEYGGSIAKQWCVWSGGRENNGDTSELQIAFLGGTDTINDVLTNTFEFAFTTAIPLDTTEVTDDFELTTIAAGGNPFSGSTVWTHITATNTGAVNATMLAKYLGASGGTLQSGLNHTRQILTLASVLSHQT